MRGTQRTYPSARYSALNYFSVSPYGDVADALGALGDDVLRWDQLGNALSRATAASGKPACNRDASAPRHNVSARRLCAALHDYA